MIEITNIERFATHDGPGIRTTVFFKGCPLHCPWCANPETQKMEPAFFYTQNKCVHCQTCIMNCPMHALHFEQDWLHWDEQKCIHCQTCVENCLKDAIEFQGHPTTVEAILEEVLKDKAYYDNSNGGMTVSGGEPLVQKENLIVLLKAAKEAGLNTAIETTGNYSLQSLQDVMPYVDTFLYDFKHPDDEILKEVTGGNGALIKSNLKYLLSRRADRVNVRMPIIPGFNYDSDTIKAAIDYVYSIGAKKINLLPYHSLGKPKFEKMNREYNLPTEMMQKKDLEEYHQYALSLGMESKIGA